MVEQELEIVGVDGVMLREYDDVILVDAVPAASRGNVDVAIIDAGTRATIITIFEDKERLANLECYVSPEAFAFAVCTGGNLKLIQRREEKLAHA